VLVLEAVPDESVPPDAHYCPLFTPRIVQRAVSAKLCMRQPADQQVHFVTDADVHCGMNINGFTDKAPFCG
jgi:hypothetical protein